MYNNDAKFQTDYEYNHSLDAYMQQSYKMPYQPKCQAKRRSRQFLM